MTACWLWDGSYFPSGYGQVWSSLLQRSTQAHRFVYEQLVSDIPAGMQLDHLCRIRGCVNPAHLRVVTCRENILAPRSTCIAAGNAGKTHCPNGHEYDAPNTYVARGKRHCRICKNANKRVNRRARRISAHGSNPPHAAVATPGIEAAANSGNSSSVIQHAGLPGSNCLQVIEAKVDGEYTRYTDLGH